MATAISTGEGGVVSVPGTAVLLFSSAVTWKNVVPLSPPFPGRPKPEREQSKAAPLAKGVTAFLTSLCGPLQTVRTVFVSCDAKLELQGQASLLLNALLCASPAKQIKFRASRALFFPVPAQARS